MAAGARSLRIFAESHYCKGHRPWSGIPDVQKAMQEGWSTASEEIRAKGFGAGMGLPNMKKVSDAFEIQTKVGEGTTVIMTFLCQ